MKTQDTISRWLGYSLLIILISILGYQLWTKWNNGQNPKIIKEGFNEEIPDYFEELMKNQIENALQMKKENETPKIKFIYSGYNEIYDYVISKSIYHQLHQLESKNKSKKKTSEDKDNNPPKQLFHFENIPKLYVYVLEEQPTKIHIVFTKLKKSQNLIDLFNKTLKQETVELQQNKINDKTQSNNNRETNNQDKDNDIQIIKDLISKHNLTKVNYDLEEDEEDIKELIRLLSNVGDNMLNNFIFYPEDNKILKTNHNINDNEILVKTLKYDSNYLDNYSERSKKNPKFQHKFTNVLLGDSNFIFDDDKRKYLFTQEDLTNKQDITNFLFQNNNLGIFISLDRIGKFEMNELNSNLVELYFKINNKKGELSGQEIRDKLSSALNIEFTKQFINVNKELVEEDKKQKANDVKANAVKTNDVKANAVKTNDVKADNIKNSDTKEGNVLQEEELIENTKDNKSLTKLNNIKPNLSFYYLHNKFQIVKVIIRPYEKELIV
mgnify:FL=1